jgi:hypothetical protein
LVVGGLVVVVGGFVVVVGGLVVAVGGFVVVGVVVVVVDPFAGALSETGLEMNVALYVRRAVLNRHANATARRVPTSADCVAVSPQPSAARLARHDVSDGRPTCSAGAQDGTLKPTN